ncbi:MAG: DHH family phosphoesterase, partial [Bdellovibrionales bacterium]|nr:DHH family phosphoesterase [Bdellovibrionales bacterium]
KRMLDPLFNELDDKCGEILFIDHHPPLQAGPKPTPNSYINTKAASTGEIAFNLIKELGIELDKKMARALYTSIVFDTQMFRFIRGSVESHKIAAELLKYEKDPAEVHQKLFGSHTIQKVTFLSKALGQIEYFAGGKLAFLKIRDKDLLDHALQLDEARDVIDMIMNIDSLEAAILFREDGVNYYKISLRSKGVINVLDAAESLGGGGHLYAAGAFAHGNYEELKEKIVNTILQEIRKLS